MRDLAKYPITTDEKLAAIDWAIATVSRDSIGSIRPAALQAIKDDIIRQRDARYAAYEAAGKELYPDKADTGDVWGR